jgi:hypothetical protein
LIAGPVATDMTLSSGFDVTQFLTVETSTKAVLKVVKDVHIADSGSGIHSHDGSIIAW